MQDGFNSYSRLSEWIAEDLGEIQNIEAIDDVRAFVAALATHPSERGWLCELRESLSLIDREPSKITKLRILNETLRRIFVAEALTPESYQAHAEALRTGDELANRRRARNPLPTLDVIGVLAADPRSLSQCQRAAILASAALSLQRSEEASAGPSVLGTTLVPGATCDDLVEADGDTRVLVLVRGVAYVLYVGGEPWQPADLERAFEWMQSDSLRRLPSGVPPLVTAANRETCFEIRRALERNALNADSLATVDGCSFAICLDEDRSSSDLETVCKRLFGNYSNRWYGMTALVINAASEAGVIGSYGRGLDAAPGLSFADALYRRSLEIPIPAGTAQVTALPSIRQITFEVKGLGRLVAKATAEIKAAFHDERCFFEVGLGATSCQAYNLNCNSTLHYLIMLAANETFRPNSWPALSHAVGRRNGTGLKGGLDWMVVSAQGVQKIADASTDAEWLEQLRQETERHSGKVKASRRGYSPSYFVRSPGSDLDARLYRFFLHLGERYSTGYRSYLFRATRWPGTMDILSSSSLALPQTVRYIGRAGAICQVAGMFGLHMVIGAEHTRLFLLPGPGSSKRLGEFHTALEGLISRLKMAVGAADGLVAHA